MKSIFVISNHLKSMKFIDFSFFPQKQARFPQKSSRDEKNETRGQKQQNFKSERQQPCRGSMGRFMMDFSFHIKLKWENVKIRLLDLLKIAKFFPKHTFPVTALERQVQMRWFQFLWINVHHNSLILEGFKKIRQIGVAGKVRVVGIFCDFYL